MTWTPESPGLAVPSETATWVMEQLRQVAAEFGRIENIQLKELHAEPSRIKNGMIVLADGTDWNPGSGAGFYGRSAGAWVFLG